MVSIDHNKEPDQWDEGYMRVIRFEQDFAYLENEEGVERGPVAFQYNLLRFPIPFVTLIIFKPTDSAINI